MAVADMIFAGIMATVVAVAFILIYSIGFEITNHLEDTLTPSTQMNQTIQNIYDTLDTLDVTFAFLFFGLFVAIILIAWMVPVSAIAFGAVFATNLIFLIITPVFTNLYMEFAVNITNIDVEDVFPMMFHIMENYPLYMTLFSFILVVVLIARWRLTNA